jgi:chorismate mutase
VYDAKTVFRRVKPMIIINHSRHAASAAQNSDQRGSASANDSRAAVCRGVRGAVQVTENSRAAILEATRELLTQIVTLNNVTVEDVASVFFTTTTDLTAEYPALAARQLGWLDVALMCSHEMSVPNALPRVVRVLLHWNTAQPPSAIRHVYIRGAEVLRPDRSAQPLSVEQADTTFRPS